MGSCLSAPKPPPAVEETRGPQGGQGGRRVVPGPPRPELTDAQRQAIVDRLSKLQSPPPTDDAWEIPVLAFTHADTGNFNFHVQVSTKFMKSEQSCLLDTGNDTLIISGKDAFDKSEKTLEAFVKAEFDYSGSPYKLVMPEIIPSYSGETPFIGNNQWNFVCILVEGPITIGSQKFSCQFYVNLSSGFTNFGLGLTTHPNHVVDCLRGQGWKCVEFLLNADSQIDQPNGADDVNMYFHTQPSKLVFYKSTYYLNKYTMLKLQKTNNMSTKILSLKYTTPAYQAGDMKLQTWEVSKQWSNEENTIAMLDTGGGPLMYKDTDYDNMRTTQNNVPWLRGWGLADVTLHQKDLRVLNGTFEITLGDEEEGNQFTYTVAAASHLGAMFVGAPDLSYVTYSDTPTVKYNGINCGGISFLAFDMIIDMENFKVGFKIKSPPA
jgi:hypothetical protein